MNNLDPATFLSEEYPAVVRSKFLPCLKIGAQIASEYLMANPSSLLSNISGRLLSYAVMLQFTPEFSIFDRRRYSVNVSQVNSFKYKIPEIYSPNSVLHIAKVSTPTSLPCRSKYKTNYAMRNSDISSQIEMHLQFESGSIASFGDERKYVLLTYGSRDGSSIDFASLVLPDARFTQIIDGGRIDLNAEFHAMDASPSIPYEEKQLAQLRKEFSEKAKNIFDE